MQLVNNIKRFSRNKKLKYGILSVGISIGLFYLASIIKNETTLYYTVIVLVVITVIGVIGTQFSNFVKMSWLISWLLPFHLYLGFLTTFFYFPNLGPAVKIMAFFGLALASYIILLVNNIFLVVEEKGNLIPLYNAAVTWVQILVIVISIPFISGVYKIPSTFLIQNLIVAVSAALLCFYMIWCMSFDPDIKRTSRKEKVTLVTILTSIIFSLGVSISFFPSESFLRALFVASLLLFNLNYIYAHYKNRLSQRMFTECGLISFFFFLLLLIFRV